MAGVDPFGQARTIILQRIPAWPDTGAALTALPACPNGVLPRRAKELFDIAVAQQNTLVGKYCAVCHTDASRSGGLSLEHFDAAQMAPSLAAMMVSKLTSGVPLQTVQASTSDPEATALVAKRMKTGAMGAAGIPVPDKATIDALILALASAAGGANQWDVKRTQDSSAPAPTFTASILRELPSAGGEAASYRLVLACNPTTHAGEIQLAWAPVPMTGTLSAAMDGNTPIPHSIQSPTAAAAITLFDSKNDSQNQKMTLPAKTLRITTPSSNDVEFSFSDLPQSARQSLAGCFH